MTDDDRLAELKVVELRATAQTLRDEIRNMSASWSEAMEAIVGAARAWENEAGWRPEE